MHAFSLSIRGVRCVRCVCMCVCICACVCVCVRAASAMGVASITAAFCMKALDIPIAERERGTADLVLVRCESYVAFV